MTEDKLINKYKNYLNINKDIKTKFLNVHQKELLKNVIGNNKNIYFYGGFTNSEYEIAYISKNILEQKNIDFKITLYEIIYNKKYLNISNRNVLGTLMSLGISRDVIGDIYISNERCFFAVSKEIEKFILENFNNINSSSISLKRIEEQIEKKEDYHILSINVSSLRLDLIITHAYNINREKSKEMILRDLIKINQKPITNPSITLKENDLISVRGKGRLLINKVLGETKKGKIKIEIGKLE